MSELLFFKIPDPIHLIKEQTFNNVLLLFQNFNVV